MEKNKPLLIGVIVVIIAIAGYFLIRMNNQQVASEITPTQSTDPAATTGTSASLESTNPAANTGTASGTTPANSSTYKDGTYTATGSYISPGGKQGFQLTVTLKNGVITSTSAVPKAIDKASDQFQDKFISGYKELVVGKNIDTVKLSKVSGSSLTSGGFNDAINQIKAQAQS